MDGRNDVAASHSVGEAVVLTHEVDCADPAALDEIDEVMGRCPLSMLVLFVSPYTVFQDTMTRAAEAFPGVTVIGCTTAGEIGRDGYCEGKIVAVGFSANHFAAESVLLTDLDEMDRDALIADMIRVRARHTSEKPSWTNEFGLLLVDGLSLMEDRVTAACADALGPVPLFGGSAGDGTRFRQTAVSMNGEVHSNAAVLTYFRSDCRVEVFSLNHLRPTEQRMVVTSADPQKRIVREINAEPAAREYARILGKDPEQLDTFTFAAYPVAVRFGGQHHVRAIQQVSDSGDLVFFSAIDEGLVLSLAEPDHMAEHLDRELSALSRDRRPDTIIACDCILRRLEAEQKQLTRAVSDVLSVHGVVGFSTYGEQMGGMHVNQTMTGVAIYAPDARDP